MFRNWRNCLPRAAVWQCAFLAAFAPLAAWAQNGGVSAQMPPKTVVILTSGLGWLELRGSPELEAVRDLTKSGGVALLNPAVSGEATDAAAFLTVGAGERMAAPYANGPVLWENDAPRRVSDFAEDVVNASANTPAARAARETFRQRMGYAPPENAAVLHLGIGPLTRTQPDSRRAGLIGALGTVLQKHGRTIAVYGDYRAVLAGMTEQGIVPLGTVGRANAEAVQTADVTILSAGDARAFADLVRVFAPDARTGKINLIAACIAPPRTSGKWESLGFVVVSGPFLDANGNNVPGLLTSATTRTPGLIANVDIAPTVCQMQQINAAFPSGAGHLMRFLPAHSAQTDPFATLTRFDNQVDAAAQNATPVLVGWGTLAFSGAFAAVLAAVRGSKPWAKTAQILLLLASATFLALLPVGVFAPAAPVGYAACVLTGSALTAGAAFWAGKKLNASPLGLVFSLTVFVIALDTLCGVPLISRSALSGYFLSGVRFYGVGNEYMGVVLGAAIGATGLLAPLSPRTRVFFAVAAAFLTLLIGLPVFGANAGGAVSCAVGFGCAFWALGGRLRFRHVVLSFVIAFALVALLAATDAARTSGVRSHIGEAAAIGAHQNGLSKLALLVSGKIAMNARLTASPFALAALCLFVPLFGWLRAGKVGETVRVSLESRPVLRRVVPAWFWGAGAAFVFNDSGVVPALLIFACITASVLIGVCDTVTGIGIKSKKE